MPTHYQGKPDAVRALDTFVKLIRATDSVTMRLAHRHTFGNLTISQFGVLEALYHLGALCQSELSSKLLKSGGNLTLVVNNLVKQDLVRRERDPEDRRRVVVSLTDEGEACIAKIFPQHVADIVAEFDVLSPEEQVELGRLCRKLGKQNKSLNQTS